MRTAVLLLLACAVWSETADAQKPEYKRAPGAMAQLPFSEAVQVGDILYMSGQIGTVPGTLKLIEGGIQAETRQTLDNIKEVLERHGGSLDNVVRCLVMLADMSEWGKMNEVYTTYFPKNKPARSSLGASGLALNARVEIECTAYVGK